MNSIKTINCKKHSQNQVKFICSLQECTFNPLICDTCMKFEPQHINSHKTYIYSYNDFLNYQNGKLSAKFFPSLNLITSDIEKKITSYSQHCEGEVQEIDRDFATLFKIFFNISENAKNFLKDHVKGEIRKISERLGNVKKTLKDNIELDSNKKSDSFLDKIFSKNSDKIESSNMEEVVMKLIQRNQATNKLRADILVLQSDVEAVLQNKIKYKKNEQAKKLYDDIKDSFDKSCKEMYRQFKAMIEGGDQNDLRKSIFTMKKSFGSSQTITIDLSSKGNALKQSNIFNERDSQSQNISFQLNFKKIPVFPDFKNSKVIEAITKFGSFTIKQEDSYFNSLPEQGPFQYDDGSVYLGHMKENRRYGRGKFLFPDGAYYEGYWKDDQPFGYCRFIKSNGDMYEGLCLNFRANGKGSFQCLDGYKFIGEFQDDIKIGIGEEFLSNGVYLKGNFINGVLEVINTAKFSDGVTLIGEFNSKLTGQGEIIYPNGEKYLGQIANGKKEGNGIYQWPDTKKYEGEFLNDSCHGKGIFWWPDGVMYNGMWKNGVQHGIGVEISDDGNNEKEGEWDNGKWMRWIK